MDQLQAFVSFFTISDVTINSVVSGTIAGILATPVVAFVIWIFKRGKQACILYPKRKLWRDFVNINNEIPIILTTRTNPEKRSSTQKVSLTEVSAYSEIRILFESLKKKAVLKPAKEGDYEEISKSSYIALGGQKSNEITKRFLQENESKFKVIWDESDEESLIVGGFKYTAKKDSDGYIAKDYGVILKTNSTNGTGKKISVMAIFGIHGYGTLGAVLCATDKPIVPLFSNKPDILVVVEVEVKKQAVIDYKILKELVGVSHG
jgi:hypothetical protein